MRDEILIVPDVHGRRFWEPALKFAGRVIFLGDYLDPYPADGITPDEAWVNFLRIVEFRAANPDRVTLLIGNHELHYFDHAYACTRFSARHYGAVHDVLTGPETGGLFQVCKQLDGFLFTHAGVSKGWYDRHRERFTPLGSTLEEQLNAYFRTHPAAFAEVSSARGGSAPFGSPLWADIHEHFNESEPFDPHVRQIIGHTRMDNPEPYTKRNITLTDNRKLHILKNGTIKSHEK